MDATHARSRTRRSARGWVSALAGAGALAAVSPAAAHQIEPMSDLDLVRQSSLVLEGQVTSLRSEWTPDGAQIHTVAEVAVRDLVKGDLDEGTITLRLLGGSVGDITQWIVGAPSLGEEEEVFLMLRADYRQTLFPIVGFEQGKLHIDSDPLTGARTIRERGMPKDAYVATLREIVAAQGR